MFCLSRSVDEGGSERLETVESASFVVFFFCFKAPKAVHDPVNSHDGLMREHRCLFVGRLGQV